MNTGLALKSTTTARPRSFLVAEPQCCEDPSGSCLWPSHDEDLAVINLNYNVMPGDVAGD